MSELREILFENGFGYVWNSQGIDNENVFLINVEKRMKDVHFQNWYERIPNSSNLESYGPGHAKMCLTLYANNKGADQHAHPRSLISTFVVRCLDSMI